ncbi:hypothetical protein JE958_005111 [Vibrio harveyi]|nr:hypothetical protein [Vibrio harveyi]
MNDVDLKAVLLGKSDIEKVILTHIHIEHLVIEFLSDSVEDAVCLEAMKLDYFSKVNLSLALGMSPDLKKPLLQLGKIRNDFAHKLDQVIDKSRINNFYDGFSSLHRQKMYGIAHELEVFGINNGVPWKQIEPQNKFSLCCISLYYFVRFAVMENAHKQKLRAMAYKDIRRKIDERV